MSKWSPAHENLHVKKSQVATRYRIHRNHWPEQRLGSRVVEPRLRGSNGGERGNLMRGSHQAHSPYEL